MMKLMNLSIFSLIPLIALAYTECNSRFALTLLHWNNKVVNGSYVKLKNNPLLISTYNFTVTTGNGTGVQSSEYTVKDIRHDMSGLVNIRIRWPSNLIATRLNLTISEVATEGIPVKCIRNASVLMQTTPPPPRSQSVYYPRDAHTGSVSMRYINNTWMPEWDKDIGEIWLLDQKNPQQVQLIEVTQSNLTVYCFVCANNISTDLGNYIITLRSGDGVNKTIPLNNMTTDSLGLLKYVYDEEFNAVSYKLTFSMRQGDYMNTSLVSQGRIAELKPTPATGYTSVYRDGPVFDDVHLNEVHFPKTGMNSPESNSFWIEFIGPANANLSSYCVALTSLSKNTSCAPLGLSAVTSGNGYYIWTPDEATLNMGLSRTYESISQRPSEIYSIRLHRETQVSVKLLERVTFTWRTSDFSDCEGKEGFLFLASALGDVLCLNQTNFLIPKINNGLSRCGIQKDPELVQRGTSMTVWYTKPITKKGWNYCNRPLGFLSKIALLDNKITISSLEDSIDTALDDVITSRMHLPNMGLMFAFWHTSGSTLNPVNLRGVDLTIDESGSDMYYPMSEMNITLRKKDEPYVNGASLYASGGVLSSFVKPYVYVVALVHYYSFLPPFNILQHPDQVVDAVVYSPKETNLSIEAVSLAMQKPITIQGQIVLDKSDSPVMVNTENKQGLVDSWKGVALDGSLYELDKLYVLDNVLQYARITMIGNNQNPYVELQLLSLPSEYTALFDGGLSLSNLCLTVSVYSASSNRHQTVAFSLFNEDNKLMVGGTYTAQLAPVIAGDVVYSLTAPSYLLLFKKPDRSTDCLRAANVIDFQPDKETGSDSLGLTIDAVGLTHQTPTSALQQKLSDDTEVARCNSKKPIFGPAFSVVNLTKGCPVPHDLFIYKICQQRIGIMSDKTDFYPLSTDYLYLVHVDNTNKVVNVTALNQTYSYLAWKHSIINAPDFLIFSTDRVTSYALVWFPNGAPTIGSHVTNRTLSVAVVYPHEDLKATATRQLTNILQTAELPENARRSPVLYAPSPGDRRHCVVGCSRHETKLSELIDFETVNFTFEDKTCFSGYSQQYRDVRINEINVDTLGFKDEGEFIELTGTPNFEYASGLSVALITVSEGEVIYKTIVNVDDTLDKAFDSNGFFIFEYTNNNKTANHYSSLQTLPFHRFLPNEYGAIALLWGAKLVDGVESRRPVRQNHTSLPDFFLDLIIYARNQTVALEKNVKRLLDRLSTEKKTIQGNVAIESHGAVNSAETISRCFCKDSWDMSCFEMSYNETKGYANICPSMFKKELTWCVTDMNITEAVIADHITKFLADTRLCLNFSCFFSKYQVQGFESCELDTKRSLKQWNFTVGFPTEQRYEQLGSLITIDNLKSFGAAYLRSCPDVSCKVPSSKDVTDGSSKKGLITGLVVGGLVAAAVIIVGVFAMMAIKKRRTKKRHLSARFEAHGDDDDDDTFLPEGGTISFSNPRYHQNGSEGNENGNKKQYQRLTQDKF
ncbi:uncharacterized protein [Watersipora subatra]|uniref:uncharacterized protein isoform X2 n=1 Tax=Watersipora subatra TaxID=2589382 RepID=UPI00355B5052